jgi:tRNA pseudouridine38-40 synthase
MPRYRFAIEYLGSAFAGWQIQTAERTAQGALEAALKIALRADCRVTGSGRTDTGVHARGQVAHFDHPTPVDPRKLQRSLNALCRPDLAVRGLEACDDTFHARYSAQTRCYSYRLTQRLRPLDAGTTWLVPVGLDLALMRREMDMALGSHDFLSFCLPRNDGKSTHCTVVRFKLVEENGLLRLDIEANRFLHRMVRSLVGAVLEVGRGATEPGLIAQGLARPGQPLPHWTWAPAQGLCLERVTYKDYDPDWTSGPIE